MKSTTLRPSFQFNGFSLWLLTITFGREWSSQFPVDIGYEIIGEQNPAGAIFNDMANDAHRIDLKRESVR
jgi:hypothetical protein